MKKLRIFAVLLAAFLVAASFTAPVFAAPGDEAAGASSEPVPETGTSGSEEASGPVEETLPSHISGDASVSMGSHSLDAQSAVAGPMEYLAECKGVMVYERTTDTLLYANNEDTRLFPADLTKIMSCLVALELGKPEELVTVDADPLMAADIYLTGVELQEGEQITLENLLYCMMVASADDAALTIAHHLAGSEDAFVTEMNRKASELGCKDTHFTNSTGIHDEDQYTSCRDMTKILTEALKNEAFCRFFSESYLEIPATNLSESRTLVTTNYMMSEAVTQNYFDPRVTGGRTGFTKPAGRCLAIEAESNGMDLVIVMLGAQVTYAEDEYSVIRYGNFEETTALMNFLFNNYMMTQVLSRNQILDQFPVSGGDSDTNGCTLKECSIIIPVGSDLASLHYEYELDGNGIQAPVKAGDPIGIVRVWYQTKCAVQQEMYSSITVEKQNEKAPELVNPAVPVEEHSSLWDKVLVVILSLLALLGLFVLIIQIRNARIRAARKKRRAAARRRRRINRV